MDLIHYIKIKRQMMIQQRKMLRVTIVLVFSILLSGASALRDISDKSSSCSSKFVGFTGESQHRRSGSGVYLDLHQAHGPCSPTGVPQRQPSDLLKDDEHRVRTLISRLSGNATTTSHRHNGLLRPESLRSPLSSGNSVGAGNYIASIGLGTPSTSYFMVVDTGSSFNWLQCAPCTVSCHEQVGPVYNPKASSTYQPVGCSSVECSSIKEATLNSPSCNDQDTCVYEASYGDGSFSVGYVNKDTLRFAGGSLSGFTFGCGQDNEGLFGQSAGLIGLSRNKLSMLSQLAPEYGDSFSYCLPSTSGSGGYLSIGPYTSSNLALTPMVSSSLDSGLYFLNLVNLIVNSNPISVASSAYTTNPTIIDSGTVISRLPSAVYTALSEAIVAVLPNFGRAPSPVSLFDTCYLGSYRFLNVPEVRMVFGGNAEIKLSPENLFYDLTREGVTCLALAPSSSITIIGNLQHTTFDVVYDVGKKTIGFAPGGCS